MSMQDIDNAAEMLRRLIELEAESYLDEKIRKSDLVCNVRCICEVLLEAAKADGMHGCLLCQG